MLNSIFSKVEQSFLQAAGDYDMTTKIPYILAENFPKLGLMTSLRFLEWVADNPEGVISLPTGKTPEFFIRFTEFLLENWNKKRGEEIRKLIERAIAITPSQSLFIHSILIASDATINPNSE